MHEDHLLSFGFSCTVSTKTAYQIAHYKVLNTVGHSKIETRILRSFFKISCCCRWKG